MNRQHHGEREMDGFRILALSRIPRCAGCPRFEAIRRAYLAGRAQPRPVPEARAGCRHEVCGPMLPRLFAAPPFARILPADRRYAANA